MGLFRRGYDRDYDQAYRTAGLYGGRSTWGRSAGPVQPYYGTEQPYRNRGYDREGSGYGRYGSRTYYGSDYGRGGYPTGKSRAQTNYGDPFGDRVQQTPIRVIREGDRGWGRGVFSGRDRERYDASYGRTAYRTGYTPYARGVGYDTGYGARSYRTYGRSRYDNDWF